MSSFTAVDAVLETFPLGPTWHTIDPFLFVAHHRDGYPKGRGDFGPAAPLTGRDLGMDFSGLDGWSMYHGRTVPGFPQHPHRGFETITYARNGLIDHSDSLGATARFGRGDTQWMTAGSGIVHAEMFPLVDVSAPNPTELFQIWLNLPAADKMVDPYFTMAWTEDTPVVERVDAKGRRVGVTVIAGELGDKPPATPPPDSWAAKTEADVAIWHLTFDAGATWELPPANTAQAERVLYVFDGDHISVGGEQIASGTGAMIRADRPLSLTADDGSVECLLLQGRPIGEPIAQYGPFVMNDHAEIQQAMIDYRQTGFGGWPWPADDPVHGNEARFARHADGTLERPPA